jgi:hypothetical protein
MELKIKSVDISLTRNEADQLEEELHSIIYELGKDHTEVMQEKPTINNLLTLLTKEKTKLTIE